MSWPRELQHLIEASWSVGEKFTLTDLYGFRDQLAEKYPTNRHVSDSIRNTVVVLKRDGTIEMIESGVYRRLR